MMPEPSRNKVFRVGTLIYSKAGLISLFAWLLWADVCFVLMEGIPGLIPLKLKALDTPNWLMAVMLSTIPMLLNATICPWVSFKSDRHRSKLGRRLPFILYTAPFLTCALIAIGFSDPIGHWLHRGLQSWGIEATPNMVILGVIGFSSTMFAFFNMFVGSVFWYLFNDVVPQEVLSRFLSLMRVASTATGAFYNFFIFRYAETHMAWIFLGGAVLYFVTFPLLCLFVKEGEYPPPPLNLDGKTGVISGLKTYGLECYSHRFYWLYYMYTGFTSIGVTILMFGIFFMQEMGLTMAQIGQLTGLGGIWTVALYYFGGMLADRFHPLRMLIVGVACNTVLGMTGLVWLFITPSPHTFFLVSLVVGIVAAPIGVLAGVSAMPAEMRIFPKERYGQFCSANALVRSVFVLLAGPFAGIFVDLMKRLHHGSDFAYRYIPVWTTVFGLLGFGCLSLLFLEWKRLGGDESFVPPEVGGSGLSESLESAGANPSAPLTESAQ